MGTARQLQENSKVKVLLDAQYRYFLLHFTISKMAPPNISVLDSGLQELESCLNSCFDSLNDVPECGRAEVFSEAKSRLMTGKKKLGILREVIGRKHVKVAFFGRTSSGKSSVINSLLGESILPCGLGRTTGCFVEIRGTSEPSPCLLLPRDNNQLDLVEVEPSSISTVVSSLSTQSFGPDTSVVLLWPRGLSPIFQESDVVLLDSPGIDVDGDCDGWIEKFCMDADLFVWVVNGESTVNVREKEFFRKVAATISQPNILVLVNRWDCTSEEEEYFIHAAHSQHVDRTCDLLVSRLGVAHSTDEARRRMFFVSAKEVSEAHRRSSENLAGGGADSGCSVQRRLLEERKEEWDRFVASMLSCVSASARTTLRFIPHLETSLSIARQTIKDMEQLQSTYQKMLLDDLLPASNSLKASLKVLEGGMEALTPELKTEIATLLDAVEKAAEDAFAVEVVEGLKVAISNFEAVFHDDLVSAIVFKDRLRKYAEDAVKTGLATRLNRRICSRVDSVQQSIVERVTQLIPEEKRDFIMQVNPRRMPLDLTFLLGSAALHEFVGDITFKSSLSPNRLWRHYMKIRRKILDVMTGSHGNLVRQVGAVAGVSAAEASIVSSVAFCAQWLQCLPIKWRPLLLSIGLSLAAAVVTERLMWTPAAKECELRGQFCAFALRRLRTLEPMLLAHCRSAAQKELASTLVLSCGAAEGAELELGREVRKLDRDCSELEKCLKNKADLIDRIELTEKSLLVLRRQYDA